MNISQNGLSLIEGFEGFSPTPYQDTVGVWTIGYGTTGADVSPLPQHVTRAQAGTLLLHMVDAKYGPAVNAVHPATQNQFDALASFAYNLGPGSMQWDVGRLTRAGNYQAAADAMLQYDHAGGQRLAGLTRRRQEERALYLTKSAYDPHYERFSSAFFTLGNRRVVERNKVRLHDELKKHPVRNFRQLHGLRRDLAFLRDRLHYVATVLDKQHGMTPSRQWRYDELLKRAPRRIRPSTS
jgi:lysozyme